MKIEFDDTEPMWCCLDLMNGVFVGLWLKGNVIICWLVAFFFHEWIEFMLSSGLWEYWGTCLFVGFGWFGCDFIRIWMVVEMMGFGV